ncbi:MAG TPA: response regulator [Planctomycetota bacterium]|nr:response regulator [Planctomycetota bacterium]
MMEHRDGRLVLCVDDEPMVLSALVRALRREPYDLLTTESPERALDWVATRDISLVMTDQKMPGMKGTELLREISRRSPSTARLLLTAYPGTTLATPDLLDRAEGLISKPWDSDMLRRMIRQVLVDRERGFELDEELPTG